MDGWIYFHYAADRVIMLIGEKSTTRRINYRPNSVFTGQIREAAFLVWPQGFSCEREEATRVVSALQYSSVCLCERVSHYLQGTF
jgi:transposase